MFCLRSRNHGHTQLSGKGGSNFVNIGDLTFYNGGGGGGGGCRRCRRGGGGGGSALTTGGGGGIQSASYINQFVNHMHAFSTKTQGTSRQTGPLRTCPVVLHRFVEICPYN